MDITPHERGKMQTHMTRAKQAARLLTLPQAAEEWGIKVNTIRAWIYRREIDYVKIGRSVRISEDTIQKLIARGSVPAREPRA
jgi:excisionase family DNA binding protein